MKNRETQNDQRHLAVSMRQRSCIVIGMKLVICFILALAPLAASVGMPLYGTHGYPAPRTEKGSRNRKAHNVRSGRMRGNPSGPGPSRKCGACSAKPSENHRQQEQNRPVR
jgi:hypothetical protein